ncbi:MAG: RQC domain-containing protein [Opitutaceae bacterium]
MEKATTALSTNITEDELRAVLGVCDALIGAAGRTTLVLGLRGSRAKKALQFGLDKVRGYGLFADRSQEEVMAIVDGLIRDRILSLEYHDDLPLLAYTPHGLELAKAFVVDEWFALLRANVEPVANGAKLALPFLYSVEPQRNNDTVQQLIAKVGQAADSSWLPLLRAWQALETRRMRAQLQPIIVRLE